MDEPGAPSDEAPDRRPQAGSTRAAVHGTGPPPPPGPDAYRARFDGGFVGPMLPPSAPRQAPLGAPAPPPAPRAPLPPPVSEAVLAIPLGTRALVRQALDLLTRRDAGLRGASFYIGFMLLATLTPMVVILGLALTLAEPADLGGTDSFGQPSAWPAWLLLAAIPAFLGYLAAATEARSLATAVIGGRVEGRPLRLRESIAVARRRFWAMLGAQLLAGLIAMVASVLAELLVLVALGNSEELNFALSLVVSIAVATPFVYVPAGIVLGEVTVVEAIARSIRLVRLRKRLALVVTLFGVFSQFIVLFGLSTGIDIVARVLIGSGLAEDVPRPVVVPVAAALVFALGTLVFLAEAIAAAPAVHAFEALTHYTHGLEVGRSEPVRGRRLWDPWLTPGLALTAMLGLVAVVGAVVALPA